MLSFGPVKRTLINLVFFLCAETSILIVNTVKGSNADLFLVPKQSLLIFHMVLEICTCGFKKCQCFALFSCVFHQSCTSFFSVHNLN
jgi:hypothetical protein